MATPTLLGRRSECAALDELDASVRAGPSRALAVPAADWEPSSRASDLLLDALALRFADGCAAAAPGVKRAPRAFRDEPVSEEAV